MYTPALSGRQTGPMIRAANLNPWPFLGALLWYSVTAAAATAAATSEAAPSVFMRGMTVSCPGYGQIWGSSSMTESLGQLRDLGVEWVSIHPYAGVRQDGTIRHSPAAETGYLSRAVEIASDAGIKLFWKPHLAYWGSFGWRGDIEFGENNAAWRRFFDGYREFIVDQARFAEAAGAELFAVGVEYDKTTSRESEWRTLIRAVREVYSGEITYAANWDQVEAVPFWDALDWIGVHAYFPLSERTDPDRDALWHGWDAPLAKLRALSAAHGGKRVVFAEIGYNLSRQAAERPWSNRFEDSQANRALRLRLIEVALERVEAEPVVGGMFWWKWMPGRWSSERDFSMRREEARESLQRHWGAGAR